jgi:hypothetical protein
MAEKDKGTASSLGSFGIPPELLAAGEKQMQAFTDLQKQMQGVCEEAARYATERVQAEAELARSLGERLSTAKSPTEAAQHYQDWLNRRMQLLAEDGQRVTADAQKLITLSMRAFSGMAAKP